MNSFWVCFFHRFVGFWGELFYYYIGLGWFGCYFFFFGGVLSGLQEGCVRSFDRLCKPFG